MTWLNAFECIRVEPASSDYLDSVDVGLVQNVPMPVKMQTHIYDLSIPGTILF